MPYVAKDDIIMSIDNELNFIQGSGQSYKIDLYKDFIGNSLNLNQPTSIHVAIFVGNEKVVQYSNPSTPGVSDNLIVNQDDSQIEFAITAYQSTYLPDGDLFAQLSIIYENYYPQPKTYVFPMFKLGSVIDNPDIGNGGGDTGGGDTGGGDTGGGDSVLFSSIYGEYMIQHIDGDEPTSTGAASVDNNDPYLASSIIFRNLDLNGIRLTALENFLTKRISSDEINGVLTIYDTEPTNMYAIYKIDSWERLDLNPGSGDQEDADGIKIYISAEAVSSGPGVTQSLWQIGQKVTFSLDAHGITGDEILPDGILTYVDKNINPIATTGNEAGTTVRLSYSPYQDSYVTVEINGLSVEIGDGVKDKAAYFSGDAGVTSTRIEEIRANDELYWNGEIAGYDLEAGDEVNLIYEAKSDDLR